ncbi:hypothetical protein GCM10023144_20890 [Pigmentiphaga soli]|uniref:Heparinase n=1 Tax=Pigmentiphaga soli TaxID=1007095 RepID=A0ABP8GZG6_9BURK
MDFEERRRVQPSIDTAERRLEAGDAVLSVGAVFDRMWWRVRYLPPVRALAAVKHRFAPADWGGGTMAPAVRQPVGSWLAPVLASSMTGPRRFRFLGIERELSDNRGWRWKPWGDEWLSYLHAFDDLVADGADSRREWHQSLISNWTLSNHPGKGMGWSPRSLPRRVANWVKFGLRRGEGLPESGRRSLVVQVRYLRQRLGAFGKAASPISVAKALLFAGVYFQGGEADAWRRTGLALLDSALRSASATPASMAGRVAIEDLLDLVQLARLYPGLLPDAHVQRWEQTAARWLAAPPAAAEAAFDAVPIPSMRALAEYGQRLGLRI